MDRLHWILAAATLSLAACTGGSPGPVPIDPADSCDFCRMVISDVRYAGEVRDAQGTVYKFDDLGCLRRFLAERPVHQPVSVFVEDYETRMWLPASDAWFVESSEFRTPMSGGIVAFADFERAKAAAAAKKATPVRYGELPAVALETRGASHGW